MTLELLAGLAAAGRRDDLLHLRLLAALSTSSLRYSHSDRARSACRVQIASPPVLYHCESESDDQHPRKVRRSTSKNRTVSPCVAGKRAVAVAPPPSAAAGAAVKRGKKGVTPAVHQGFRLRSNTAQKEIAQAKVQESKEARAAAIRKRKLRNATGVKVKRSSSTERPAFAQPTLSSMAPTTGSGAEAAWEDDAAPLSRKASSQKSLASSKRGSMLGMGRTSSGRCFDNIHPHASGGTAHFHSGTYDSPAPAREGMVRVGRGGVDVAACRPYVSPITRPAKQPGKADNAVNGAKDHLNRKDSGLHAPIRPILKKTALLATPPTADAHLVNSSATSPVAQVAAPPVIWA